MRVSEKIVEHLIDHGINTVFGIPGTQTLPLNEAIERFDEISYVMARHETAVTHQAWGYGQTGGGMAATLVVPGPGDMNAMNGLKNALNDCTPLLHLSIETDPTIRSGDGIHETPHDTYDNVVKENILVENPTGTVAAIADAIVIARTPPKGPVRVGVPRSFLTEESAASVEIGKIDVPNPPSLNPSSVERLTTLLNKASNPVIIAGGGVRIAEASSELQAVAEKLSAPVFVTIKGKGVFREDHPLFAGILWGGMSEVVREEIAASDATFAIGSDLDAVTTNDWEPVLPNLLHVTLHYDDLGGARNGYNPAFGLIADAKDVLTALADSLKTAETDGSDRAAVVRDREASQLEPLRESMYLPLNSVQALDVIRESLPRDAIVTADSGGCRLWTVVTFDVYDAHSYVNPGSWASMGTGLPAAIGAKVANDDQPVVSIIGDGGLMMCIHELHTAIAEDIDVVTVVFNNSDYAIISDGANAEFGMAEEVFGWGDAPIDFATVADGLGLANFQAETPEEISSALEAALSEDGASVVEIMTDSLEAQTAAWMADG
jgi:acetolactate synthase-1/2/3 large subunit